MLSKKTKPNDMFQRQILQKLGLDQIEDEAGLDKVKKQLRSQQLDQQFAELKEKSEKKKKRVRQNMLSIRPAIQASDELKQLEWRLQILREDRKQRQKSNGQSLTFDQLYNRQKNKYMKFRDRQKIKISDPKYLQMIGSTQMRRQLRKMTSMQKINKHFEQLDMSIQNHSQNQSVDQRNQRKRGF